MTSQEIDTPTLEADIEAAISDELEAKNTGSADVLDRAGNAILGLVTRAAGTVQADLREARQAAEKLADQLRATRDQLQAAQDQINLSRPMLDTMKIGQIVPRNGCTRFHLRSSKSF